MAFLADVVLDGAIAVLTGNVTTLYLCNDLPTNYTQASATYKVGTKTSYTLGSVQDGASEGRRTIAPAITDGAVEATDTATHWAVTSGSVLYAAGALTASQAVTSGNTFTLTAFSITVKDAIAA